MSKPKAGLHYHRALTQFGCMIRGARKHQQVTINGLSVLSGVSEQRLMKYESAVAPPHWADTLRLSTALNVRVSFIIKTIVTPLLALSLREYRSVVAFAREQESDQRFQFRADVENMRLVHWEEGWDARNHDVTIAAWPEFLLPSLGDALMGEASRLHTLHQVLQELIEASGRKVVVECEEGYRAAFGCSEALSRVLAGMESIRRQLQYLTSRHRLIVPQDFDKRMNAQRMRIADAIESIESSLGRSLVKSHFRWSGEVVEAIHVENGRLSRDLRTAVERAIVASFGVTKIALGSMKSSSASAAQMLRRMRGRPDLSMPGELETIVQREST